MVRTKATRCHDTVVFAHYTSSSRQLYVILTTRSLLWTTITIVTTAVILFSIFSPNWLIGEVTRSRKSGVTLMDSINTNRTPVPYYVEHWKTVGLINGCEALRIFDSTLENSKVEEKSGDLGEIQADRLVHPVSIISGLPRSFKDIDGRNKKLSRLDMFSGEVPKIVTPQQHATLGADATRRQEDTQMLRYIDIRKVRDRKESSIFIRRSIKTNAKFYKEFLREEKLSCPEYDILSKMADDSVPDLWKWAFILLLASAALLSLTTCTAVISVCMQSICRKSIFTVSGLIQSIAALFLIVGQLIYMAGWGSDKVKGICGERSGPFDLDQCSFGVGTYGCAIGTVLVFVCALLSIQAESATSTDKVEEKVIQGHRFVCII